MSKNTNLTSLDANQIVNRKFDESHDADRVVLVGGEKLSISIDETKLVNAVKEGLSLIKFENQSSEQLKIETIEKNIFIPQIEIREIERPVIIKEIEYREIEKPIIIEKIVTIEKPIIIKETEFKEVIKERHYPLILKICAIVQAICITGILLLNVLKK